MKDPVDIKKKCEYFVPKKRKHSQHFKISDHAVVQYKERFGNGNGSVRNIIKSVIDNGEDVMYRDDENRVIHKNGIFAIVNRAVVTTVYTTSMFVAGRQRIVRNWEGDIDGEQ